MESENSTHNTNNISNDVCFCVQKMLLKSDTCRTNFSFLSFLFSFFLFINTFYFFISFSEFSLNSLLLLPLKSSIKKRIRHFRLALHSDIIPSPQLSLSDTEEKVCKGLTTSEKQTQTRILS